jgi:hypothetical protein
MVASNAIVFVIGSMFPIVCSFLNSLILMSESVSLPIIGFAYAVSFRQAAKKNNINKAIVDIKIVIEFLFFIKYY